MGDVEVRGHQRDESVNDSDTDQLASLEHTGKDVNHWSSLE